MNRTCGSSERSNYYRSEMSGLCTAPYSRCTESPKLPRNSLIQPIEKSSRPSVTHDSVLHILALTETDSALGLYWDIIDTDRTPKTLRFAQPTWLRTSAGGL